MAADTQTVDVAIGVIMEAHAVDAESAHERRREAAARAGTPLAQPARAVTNRGRD